MLNHWPRSILTNVVFYIFNIIYLILCVVVFLLPTKKAWWMAHGWILGSLWIFEHVGGMKFVLRGAENIPKNQGFIVVAKHQSAWETIALVKLFPRPAYILKQSLLNLPLFGLYLRRFQMVAIDRTKGREALAKMLPQARRVIEDQRPMMIFPEGTRKTPGEPPQYKHGFAKMYTELDATIVPVALNSGFFWPKGTMRRCPGQVIVSVLPSIPPGLSHKEVYSTVQNAVEKETQILFEETCRNHPDNPVVLRVQNTGA